MADGALTYNQEHKSFLHRQGEAVVKPDQPQAACWALPARYSQGGRRRLGTVPITLACSATTALTVFGGGWL